MSLRKKEEESTSAAGEILKKWYNLELYYYFIYRPSIFILSSVSPGPPGEGGGVKTSIPPLGYVNYSCYLKVKIIGVIC